VVEQNQTFEDRAFPSNIIQINAFTGIQYFQCNFAFCG